TVVMGNVVQAGTKMNPARQAAVQAGLPVTIPALTVNRVCGSGAQALVSAAHEILLGNINVAVAGGMENMDQAPYLIARARWGYRMGDSALQDLQRYLFSTCDLVNWHRRHRPPSSFRAMERCVGGGDRDL